MRIFKKLFFLFILFPLFSLAQSNYKPGFVVTLKGDTLQGFIDYKEWDVNPAAIKFKRSLNSNTTETFSTKNSKAFSVTGFEYYLRFEVTVSQDVFDLDKLKSKPDTSFTTDTVFLRISTAGKYLTLFSYTDKIKPRYYILESGKQQPEELSFHAFYNPDESASTQFIRRYRTQLENAGQKFGIDNEKIKDQILKSDYRERDLIKIVQAINGTSLKQFTPENILGTRWFAGASFYSSQLKFDGTANIFSGNNSSSNNLSPKISVGIDLLPNKNVQRLIIRFKYSFTIAQYTVSGSQPSGVVPSTSSLNFKQYTNSIAPQIILNIYNNESFKFFAGIGAEANFSFYSQYQTVTNYSGGFPSSVQNNYPELNKVWISLPLSAGFVLNKKVEINFTFSPASTISGYSDFSGAISSYQLGVNYLF